MHHGAGYELIFAITQRHNGGVNGTNGAQFLVVIIRKGGKDISAVFVFGKTSGTATIRSSGIVVNTNWPGMGIVAHWHNIVWSVHFFCCGEALPSSPNIIISRRTTATTAMLSLSSPPWQYVILPLLLPKTGICKPQNDDDERQQSSNKSFSVSILGT